MLISGSVRKGSNHLQLGRVAASFLSALKGPTGKPVARVIGVDDSSPLITTLPLYHQDLMDEIGHPEEAKKLRALADQADAFLFLSPEYNGMATPCMMNTLAWLSRPLHKSDLNWSNCCFRGKPAAILSMSPGQMGGIRAHVSITQTLSNLGLNVLANEKALSTDKESVVFLAREDGAMIFTEMYAGLQKQANSVNLDLLKQAVAQKLVSQYAYGDLGSLATMTYQGNPGASGAKPKRKRDVATPKDSHHQECGAYTTKDHHH